MRKFRGVEEMPAPLWSERLDPDNIRRACALMVWARRLRPHRLTPGLEKRRSTSATEPDETPGAPEAV